MDIESMTTEALAAALHEGASRDGSPGVGGAVILLTGYQGGQLLDRRDIRRHMREVEPGWAVVNWPTLHAAACPPAGEAGTLIVSGGAHAAIELACALARSTTCRVDNLAVTLQRFQRANGAIALHALYVAMAGDWKDPTGAWLAYAYARRRQAVPGDPVHEYPEQIPLLDRDQAATAADVAASGCAGCGADQLAADLLAAGADQVHGPNLDHTCAREATQ